LESLWTPDLYRMSYSNSVSGFEPKIYGMFKSRHIGLMSVSRKVANSEWSVAGKHKENCTVVSGKIRDCTANDLIISLRNALIQGHHLRTL